MAHQDKNKEYDEEPVKYCTKCYSLKIGYEEAVDTEYCMECGCSDIAELSIYEWEEMYKNRYGQKFISIKNDPRRVQIARMSYDKLREMVYKSPNWRDIIKSIYPKFHKNYNKGEAIITFFDQISRDKKLDELKLILMKML